MNIFKTLREMMEEKDWKKGNYVFNNFPYKRKEIDAWKEVFGNMTPVKLILNLHCTPRTSSQRIVRRDFPSQIIQKADQRQIQRQIEEYSDTAVQEISKFNNCPITQINANHIASKVFDDVIEKF